MNGKTNSQPSASFIMGSHNTMAHMFRTTVSDTSTNMTLLSTKTITTGGRTLYGRLIAYAIFFNCTTLSFQYDESYVSGATCVYFPGGQIVELNGSGSYTITPGFSLGQIAQVYICGPSYRYPEVYDLDRAIQWYKGSISVPETEGQIMIDTDIQGKITGFNLISAPSNPSEGDMYFTPYNRGARYGEMTEPNGFRIQLGEAFQFHNGVWEKKNAWLGEKGFWRQVSYVWNGEVFSATNNVDGNIFKDIVPLQSAFLLQFSTYHSMTFDNSSTSTVYAYLKNPIKREMLKDFTTVRFTVPGGATSSSNINRVGLAGSIGETSITDWLAYAAVGTADGVEKIIALPSNLPDEVYIAFSIYKSDYWNISNLRFV